jgi:magnesium chelatase family protein
MATPACPCGFLGDVTRECRCTPIETTRYRDRLSGPLRDRLDLTVDVPALPPEALEGSAGGETSAQVRARVVAARARQIARYGDEGIRSNAELSARSIGRYAQPNHAGRTLLMKAVTRLGLSARGYDRVRKVSRTIADLADYDEVGADHVAEALQFRMA